jgi:hypothetical protein
MGGLVVSQRDSEEGGRERERGSDALALSPIPRWRNAEAREREGGREREGDRGGEGTHIHTYTQTHRQTYTHTNTHIK